MKNNIIELIVIIAIIGVFIFIKGFQSNMEISEILSIFVMFSGFILVSTLICTSLMFSINRVLTYCINYMESKSLFLALRSLIKF